jgi:hypothetical protein
MLSKSFTCKECKEQVKAAFLAHQVLTADPALANECRNSDEETRDGCTP